MGGAGCTAGTSLALGGTMKEMMVVVWRGYTWHDGGEDHRGGGKSWRVGRAVSCGEEPHLGDFLPGREQWSEVSSCVAAEDSG